MIFPTLNLTVEKWKFNHEFGVYVSTLGNFKDRHKRNLPIKIQRRGYCVVITEKGVVAAHRLVLMTWRSIPNREIMTVDHLNHNKRDNSLRNLEWVSKEENLRRAECDTYSFQNDSDKVRALADTLYIRVNNVVMGISEAIEFITYGPSGQKLSKEDMKKYLIGFAKDTNPNRKKISKYGFIIERV